MAFSNIVRDKALVAAARRCCVCHRYKGVLIEVHHITPSADGGTDEFDNAIALCFDCHAWAGHYFAGHPRGTAFSPSELRKARDNWFSKVERNEISAQIEERSPLHVRYFLCRDWDITAALFSGDVSLAPVEKALLASTPVTRLAKELISAYHGYRSEVIYSGSFKSIEEYGAAHPDAAIKTSHPYATPSNPGYAFYNCLRQCSEEEISNRIFPRDPISAVLAANGAQLQELAIAVADRGDCGDGTICESYRVRPIWSLFIAITNTTSEPIAIESIGGLVDRQEGTRPLNADTNVGEWRLPPCEIGERQTILAPIAVLVAPLAELGEKITAGAGEAIVDRGEYSLATHLVNFPDEGIDQFRVLGPRMRPNCVFMRIGTSRVTYDVHDFDLENVFTIDRSWECGSCPHLFFISVRGDVRYARELISSGVGTLARDQFDVPIGMGYVVIAELEEEVTYLQAVVQDGKMRCENVWMRRGQFLTFPVNGAEVFEVSGAYYSRSVSVPRIELAAMRNRLVCRFLRNWNEQFTLGDVFAPLGFGIVSSLRVALTSDIE